MTEGDDDTAAEIEAAPDRLPSRPEETRAVMRGVRRHLALLGLVTVDELPLASGRRADIVALSEDGSILIIEVKSSVEDFRVDQKWHFYRQHCDRLYFATTVRVPHEIFPEDAGLIIADAYGADIMREAPEHRLTAGTRKAMLLRFARVAAGRLHGLIDPQP